MAGLGRVPLFVEYEDVLKNIEAAVVRYYDEHPDATDSQVERVYEVLIRAYKSAVRAPARPPLHQLGEMERELYARVEAVCEWCLGQAEAPWPKAKRSAATRTPEEIIACLKYLRRSVRFWTKESGRQGYLNYVKPYFP